MERKKQQTKTKQQNDHIIINETQLSTGKKRIISGTNINRKQISLLIRTQDMMTSMIIHQ